MKTRTHYRLRLTWLSDRKMLRYERYGALETAKAEVDLVLKLNPAVERVDVLEIVTTTRKVYGKGR